MSESPGPTIRWGADGLIPVVAQDERTGDVLMVAFMNAEALAATRATGYVHYWSRGRNRLWPKGETSGNRQEVVDIFVNCDRNSLLLRVRQTGAVCHEGYPTCYYRRLEPDDALTVVRERAFDPADVYGSPDPAGPLADATRLLYGAYAWLRDHDLTAESGTSRLLRASEHTVEGRVADELGELAGVLDGSHRHGVFRDDVLLEATQCLYWTTTAVLRAGADWAAVRPDRALADATGKDDRDTIATELWTVAGEWRGADPEVGAVERARRALRLVGRACRAAGVEPAEAVARDLADLRAKPYLAPYFAATEAGPA